MDFNFVTCGPKSVKVSNRAMIFIKQNFLGLSTIDGECLYDLGFKMEELERYGLTFALGCTTLHIEGYDEKQRRILRTDKAA